MAKLIPVKQDIFTSDDEKILGNCLQAAIASMTDQPLGIVPHTVYHYDWYRRLQLWLKNTLNLTLRSTSWDDVKPDEYVLVVGVSPRNPTWYHAVVYQNGALVHDPHPDNTGVTSVSSIYTLRPLKA